MATRSEPLKDERGHLTAWRFTPWLQTFILQRFAPSRHLHKNSNVRTLWKAKTTGFKCHKGTVCQKFHLRREKYVKLNFAFSMPFPRTREYALNVYLSTVRHRSSSPPMVKSKDVLKSHDNVLQKSQGGVMLKRRFTWRTLPLKMKKMRKTIYA